MSEIFRFSRNAGEVVIAYLTLLIKVVIPGNEVRVIQLMRYDLFSKGIVTVS